MSQYYVIRDKNTGFYFRGKGVNRWGKYYNQASIYRIKGMAKATINDVSWRNGEQPEIVSIQIIEGTSDAVEVVRCKDCVVIHNEWIGCPYLNGIITPPDFYCALGKSNMKSGE